ncbi:SRPBCC family protein [Marinoscillum sp.]|uniref:SRPBCC family protein n=1 Tax=Marinoscillum sp. TaxID=2024838 RepID=UPI003BA91E9F
MPKINLSRSISINAPIDKVYECVSDLGHWTIWSPWLITEPEAKVTLAEDHKSYSWEGNRTGSGNMKIAAEQTNQSIDLDLQFITPWKSTAKVRFDLVELNGGTQVTWQMDSSLPFFMFWFKKMMIAFISMDYDRGLALLKDYSEDGKVHSRLDFEGINTYPGCQYIGIKNECSIDLLGEKMVADFQQIGNYVADKNELISGEALSIYHKWDIVKRLVVYTSAIPVKHIPKELPEGYITGEIPSLKVYTLKHTGPYHHLGNAWTTLNSMYRNKEFKLNKKIFPFETYKNSPTEVPANELITQVHFPIK